MAIRRFVYDVTEYCTVPRPLQPCVDGVYEEYLYDDQVATHCCELTPSYELHPVRTFVRLKPGCTTLFDDDRLADQLYEFELAVGTDLDVRYVHCRSLRTGLLFEKVARDPEESADEHLERCVEYARCNVDDSVLGR